MGGPGLIISSKKVTNARSISSRMMTLEDPSHVMAFSFHPSSNMQKWECDDIDINNERNKLITSEAIKVDFTNPETIEREYFTFLAKVFDYFIANETIKTYPTKDELEEFVKEHTKEFLNEVEGLKNGRV